MLSLLLFLPATALSQYWPVGDNATVRDCRSTCAVDDENCWQRTADFMDKALITQLRYYAVAEIDDDQWYRRHVDGSGLDLDQLSASVHAGLASQLIGRGDVIDPATMDRIAELILDQIEDFSDHIIGWPPQYQCPTPCNYREELYFTLFILSLFINGALVLAVVPYMQRIARMNKETSRSLKEDREKHEKKEDETKGNGGDKHMKLP